MRNMLTKNLKDYRIRLGLTQSEMAVKLGCTNSAYCRYENGERELSVPLLIKFADLYNVSIDELVDRKFIEEDQEPCSFDFMAKVKNPVDITLAKSTGNMVLVQYVRDNAINYDCLSVSDAHRMIAFLEHVVDVDVLILCKIFGVSRSGYYYFKKNGDTIKKKNEYIAKLILQYEGPSLGASGVLAVRTYLRSLEEYPELRNISSERIRRIMNWFEIIPEDFREKKVKVLIDAMGKYKPHPELTAKDDKLNRCFSAFILPGKKWCVDITEINTGEGKLYLCAIVDLCGRYIVAHSTSRDLKTTFVKQAINRAKVNASKYIEFGEELCIFHSDRGAQFRADDVQSYMESNNLSSSMSNPYKSNDNACIESFFANLKCEYLYRFDLDTISVARTMIERYIHYYNKIRVHESIGMPPFRFWRQATDFDALENLHRHYVEVFDIDFKKKKRKKK